VRVYDQRVQAQALIIAGLELTAFRLIGFDDSTRPGAGSFEFHLGGSSNFVDFHSEGGRIDLNFAAKPLLSGLFATLGAKSSDADSFADHIIAWRTKAPAGNQNPEADAYKEAGLPYRPRQAPFQNTAELRLVRGLPAELVTAALPFVTVFNGRAEIDINEAAPEVIAALPGINPGSVADILKLRNSQNPQAVLALLGTARDSVAIGGRKAARASVHVTLGSGQKVNADVVILIVENGAEPYRILAWHDDFDGPI
jgi:general secretion pathway protein K